MQDERVYILWGAIEIDSSLVKSGNVKTDSDQKVAMQIAGDALCFQIPVPNGATIAAALAQVGKLGKNAVVLTRDGVTHHDAADDTMLNDGDHLSFLPLHLDELDVFEGIRSTL